MGKKRKRRSYKELSGDVQMHCCHYPGCTKKYVGSYGRFNLQVHIKIKHLGGQNSNGQPKSPGTASTVTMASSLRSRPSTESRTRSSSLFPPSSTHRSLACYFQLHGLMKTAAGVPCHITATRRSERICTMPTQSCARHMHMASPSMSAHVRGACTALLRPTSTSQIPRSRMPWSPTA